MSPWSAQGMAGPLPALPRRYQRVEAFSADPARVARHALKVMLMFTLLERRQLALDTLPGYLDSIPVYREYNHAYFGLAPSALAEMLVGELERAGAVARTGEFLKPGVGYS